MLSVKDNQPKLRHDIVASFADGDDTRCRPQDQPDSLPIETWTSTDKAHGRIEEREISVCRDLSWLDTKERWKDIAFIARARSTRTHLSSGEQTTGCRYFIGSDPHASIESIAALIRGHWTVENSVHWVLDMAFREDEARHRAGNCAQNLATLRHMVLDLVKTEPTSRLGVANKRKRAGWDKDYLIRVIAGPRA